VIGADLFYEENTTIWSGRMMLIYSEIKIPLTDYTNKQSCRFKKKNKQSCHGNALPQRTLRADLI
jgi:hypothetical protein